MKIELEIKNVPKAIAPTKDNIILYDGKQWYITTKQDLFKEYDERFKAKIAACDEKIAEMNQQKADLARQMLEYGQIIRELASKGE